MLQIQYLLNSGGDVISSLAVGSGQTVTTQGVKTDLKSSSGSAGLFLIITGTVNALTRDVSIDNTTFYTPYDGYGASLANCIGATTASTSRYISLDIVSSGQIVAPYTRFNAKMLSGGTLSMVYISNEE